MKSNRNQAYIYYSILILLLLAILVLLSEVGIRLLAPQPISVEKRMLYVPEEGLGYSARPDLDIVVETSEGKVRFMTDSLGHRVGSGKRKNPDIKILAVGDSYVQALQVEYEETFTALLEEGLSQKVGKVIKVENMGCGGWDPNQYLLATQEELVSDSFDMILVFTFLQNDLITSRVQGYPPAKKILEKEGTLVRWLTRNSQFFLFFYYKKLSFDIGRREGYPQFLQNIIQDAPISPAWDTTASILLDIGQLATVHQVPILFVNVPPIYVVDDTYLTTTLDFYAIERSKTDIYLSAKKLGSKLGESGFQFLDPTQAFRKSFQSGNPDLYGKADVHFAPGGHQLMAEFLIPYILETIEKK